MAIANQILKNVTCDDKYGLRERSVFGENCICVDVKEKKGDSNNCHDQTQQGQEATVSVLIAGTSTTNVFALVFEVTISTLHRN